MSYDEQRERIEALLEPAEKYADRNTYPDDGRAVNAETAQVYAQCAQVRATLLLLSEVRDLYDLLQPVAERAMRQGGILDR